MPILGHRIIYFMKTKDEIVETVERYLIETRAVDKQVASLVWSVSLIVTDSDKLYMSKAFQTLERQNRINHWFAAPYTHSQAAGIESDIYASYRRGSCYSTILVRVSNVYVALCLLLCSVV